MSELTINRLREVLDYNPETGVFHWKISLSGRGRVGDVAGSDMRGYWRINIDRRMYLAHRLAWFYVHCEFPPSDLDHINRIKSDNRIANLRPATVSQNKINCRIPSALGLTGVSLQRRSSRLSKPYRAAIEINGRTKHLGYFATAEAAGAAYRAEAIRVHGEFAQEVAP